MIRTTSKLVTFAHPFAFDAIEGVQPPGTYEVETDEELIEGISFVAYRRVATLIRVESGGITQIHRIDPLELEANLLRDSALTTREATASRSDY